MNIASIDIGTNTILLLIAKVNSERTGLELVHEEIRMPRIGHELNRSGKIPEEKIIELEEVLLEYKTIISQYNCSECYVIGTHALRIASNNKEIQKRILENTSLSIEIISPENEAEYAFYGILASKKIENSFAIVDIGGGSTEVIVCENDKISFKRSIPIGVVTLKDILFNGYPISEDEDLQLKNRINLELGKLDLKHHAPTTLVGISGTPTTLSAIKNNLTSFDHAVIENSIIYRNDIMSILDILKKSSLEEIIKIYGNIISKREDILYIGGVILLNIMSYLNISEVKVSTFGIRHGVIYKKMIAAK